MTESDVKKFLIEMAEHAVNIGPRHGMNMSLQQAFRWLTSAASNAAAAPKDVKCNPQMDPVNGHPALAVIGEN